MAEEIAAEGHRIRAATLNYFNYEGRAWREGMVKIYRHKEVETPFSKGRAFAITDK